MTPQAKALFMALSSYASVDTAKVWPSRQTLAGIMGMSRGKSIDKYIKELEDARFISREFRQNQSTLYEVARWSADRKSCRLSGAPSPPPGTTPGPPQGTTQSPAGDTPQSPTGDTNNTHSSIPTKKTHSLTRSSVDFGVDDWDAPRRGGQLPAEETREPSWEETESELVESPRSVEEESKDAGDEIELISLMSTPPGQMSGAEHSAMRAAQLGWDPTKKVWIDLSMW